MSARKTTKRKITFVLSAPQAESVFLVGDFSAWDQQPVSLKRLDDGQWTATLSLPEGRYEYRFLVDGRWVDDPECAIRVPNSFGSQNCVRVVT
jgi:1,4-alpha-glucan branching enzyme